MAQNQRDMAAAVTVGIGVGLVIGWFVRGRIRPKFQAPTGVTQTGTSLSETQNNMMSETGEYKLVLVVRTDLKMGKGKTAAQCSHAAVSASENIARKSPDLFQKWKRCGQPKVVVKTDTEQSLIEMAAKARKLGLNASLIQDAGRTQIAPGSKTVLGVGPGPENLVNTVTGHLKLF